MVKFTGCKFDLIDQSNDFSSFNSRRGSYCSVRTTKISWKSYERIKSKNTNNSNSFLYQRKLLYVVGERGRDLHLLPAASLSDFLYWREQGRSVYWCICVGHDLRTSYRSDRAGKESTTLMNSQNIKRSFYTREHFSGLSLPSRTCGDFASCEMLWPLHPHAYAILKTSAVLASSSHWKHF